MDIIRAWKDEEYRLSLTEEQRALLPDNPAGLMTLSDDELHGVVGDQNINITAALACIFSALFAICNSFSGGNCG
jgi:mersacidin/lichenicidin family type 2 lantibiotic